MFCDKCGKEIKEGNTFCTNCGAGIIKNETKSDKKTISISLNKLVIIIVIPLVLVLLLTFIILNHKKNTSINNNTNTTDNEIKTEEEIIDPSNEENTSLLDEIKAKYPTESESICTDGDNYWLLSADGDKVYFTDLESFEMAMEACFNIENEDNIRENETNINNENNNSNKNSSTTANEDFIRIPDLTGMTEQQAINKAKELSVPYKVVYREDLSYEEEGIVIDQTTHTQILKDIKGNIVAAYSLRILKPRRNTCYYSK